MCGSKYNNFVFITTIRNLWLWVVMTWKHTTHKKYFSQDIYMTWYNITAPKNIPHQLATHYCNISLGSIIVIQIWWRLVEYTIRLSIMGDDKYNYITGKMEIMIRVLLQNYLIYDITFLWANKSRMNDEQEDSNGISFNKLSFIFFESIFFEWEIDFWYEKCYFLGVGDFFSLQFIYYMLYIY